MRFWAVHKWATYLVAATAFIGIVLSGELDPATLFIGLVGIVGSWWVEPPRFRLERAQLAYTILAVLAFGVAVLGALAGDFLLSGARFLIHLLVLKLLSRRSARDYQQIYTLSFLLMAGGSAINVGVSFAVTFLAFVIFATWALILFHLRREMEENFLLKHSEGAASEKVEVERILNSKRIVGASFLWSTSGVSIGIFLLSAILWALFPRVGFGWLSHRASSGVNVAGFADGVKLGGHGRIRQDNTVVMRVEFDDPAWRGARAQGLHWRGVAFDTYERGEWKRSLHQENRRQADSFLPGNLRRLYMTRDERRLVPGTAARHLEGMLHQRIFLAPLETSVLFAASTPHAVEAPIIFRARSRRLPTLWTGNEVRLEHEEQLKYEAWSDPIGPPEAVLAAAPDLDAAGRARMHRFLQLPGPDELPERVVDKARELTRGARGPHEKAQRIWQFLQDEYSYTLDMVTPTGEPIDHFLFTRKQGHCEYFASAMAILLRAADVPTRNVNGFLGGEWNAYGGFLAVRNGDAHSWLEVWYEGVGWVTWDPTPPAGREVSVGTGWLDDLRRFVDSLRQSWYKWVLEYDLRRQLDLFRGIGSWFKVDSGKASIRSAGAWAKRHRWQLAAGALSLGALVLAFAWWRSRRAPTGPGAPRRSSDPVVQLYARTVRWLARHGAGPASGDTPREHAAKLVAQSRPGATAFAALTELYYTARYAPPDLRPPTVLADAERLAATVKKPSNPQGDGVNH